jgi:hypothetical protein
MKIQKLAVANYPKKVAIDPILLPRRTQFCQVINAETTAGLSENLSVFTNVLIPNYYGNEYRDDPGTDPSTAWNETPDC